MLPRVNKIYLIITFSLCILVYLSYTRLSNRFPGVNAQPVNVVEKRSYSVPIEKIDIQKDSEIEDRKLFVQKMMQNAWEVYKKYAFGAAEVSLINHQAHRPGHLGSSNVGTTIVDSIDTLFIMGLNQEYNEAREWIIKELKLEKIGNICVSFFEFNIRIIGGLLSIYYLTGDQEFLSVLKPIAYHMISQVPDDKFPSTSLSFGNCQRSSSHSTNLAELGTFHLEWLHLTEVYNDPIFAKKANIIRDRVFSLYNDKLPPDILSSSGQLQSEHYSLGAYGDSFYEYLLKSFVMTDKKDQDGFNNFKKYIKMLESKIIRRSKSGYLYVGVYRSSLMNEMEHLACFTGGMYALASLYEEDPELKKHYLNYAEDITSTCHESYIRTPLYLGPEIFQMIPGKEFYGKPRDHHYLLRPEVVESYFYLWRVTKDPKYREWAWNATLNIESHCKVRGGGYSGITNVNTFPPTHDGIQQSFFLAETLKYLYLIFTDGTLRLDSWIFNTEAHPLPKIGGKKIEFKENQEVPQQAAPNG